MPPPMEKVISMSSVVSEVDVPALSPSVGVVIHEAKPMTMLELGEGVENKEAETNGTGGG
eukprot:CAMPEP_0197056920 /NCGR_PEP_ID=MMETSP1384-20130603/91236_1 /TAXON_ID=29189 /ORGANISM="Ammonia sp." /LENGTH=59 /DNA_ID=CAMNT_0042491117 /DNA_START=106 /DNA_END=282 /DNA_ORIENTATION=-